LHAPLKLALAMHGKTHTTSAAARSHTYTHTHNTAHIRPNTRKIHTHKKEKRGKPLFSSTLFAWKKLKEKTS
jgi:hypothetical protein